MPDNIPPRFEPLFEHLKETWFAQNDYKIGDPFTNGHTGALVAPIGLGAKAESSGTAQDNRLRGTGAILEGEFVLKLDAQSEYEERTEGEHHEEARKWNAKFSEKHMLVLKKPPQKMGGAVALLYDVAGHNLHGIESADAKDAGELEACVRKVSRSLLDDWNPPPHAGTAQSAWDFIQQWSAHRLQEPRLRDTEELVTQGKSVFCFFERTLANPLRFNETPAGKKEYPLAPIRGMLHNDLHLRNILAPRKQGTEDFWLIDFAYAHKGFLLYDHAYLEVSLLLKEPERFKEQKRLHNLLVALEKDPNSIGSRAVSPDDRCLLECIRGVGFEVEKWTKKSATSSLGAVKAQFLLARVSAGLNWANKPLEEPADRKTAFIYAAWAASRFMRENDPDGWGQLIEGSQCSPGHVW